MKYRVDVATKSSKAWLNAVMGDFDEFLKDHADAERKASAMAMSFVAKYPDKVEIIPQLIDTAVEELEHFRDVYKIIEKRGLQINHEISKDLYVTNMIRLCRNGRVERFIDRMLVASIVECRGAERFKLIYEALEDKKLKNFYHKLWASEAKHGEIYVQMLLNYFDKNEIYSRLREIAKMESKVIREMDIRPALH